MEGILISIYDCKAETYSPPEIAKTRPAALRQFEMIVNSSKVSEISQHPEDFTLFEVGTFDGCKIVGNPAPVRIATGNEVKKNEV